MKHQEETTTSTSFEIVSARIFHVPKVRLFKAWVEPSVLARWWGPKGFVNTFHEFDFNPGGNWNFTMQGPDGTDYKNKSIFIKIIPSEEIVFDHITGPKYRGIATFTDTQAPDQTLFTYCMQLESQAAFKNLKEIIIAGNEEIFDRLEEVL